MDIQWVSMDLQTAPVFPLKTVSHPLTETSFIHTDPTIHGYAACPSPLDIQIIQGCTSNGHPWLSSWHSYPGSPSPPLKGV